MNLKIHHIEPCSYANGPGRRFVIWTQGCSIRCPGCFNKKTWDESKGESKSTERLAAQITSLHDDGRIDGITISGGEPLDQFNALSDFLYNLRENDGEFSPPVILFTGYTWNEVGGMHGILSVIGYVDLLIAGPYEANKHVGTGLLGSSNQSIHFLTDRYTMDDLLVVPEAEVSIGQDGLVTMSGIEKVGY